MQLFLNNWSARLTSPLSSTALMLQIPGEAAVQLSGLGGGDHYLLTLAAVDNSGTETAWEIVKVTAAAGGSLTIERAQEGTVAAEWPVDSLIEARLTAGALVVIRDTPGPAGPAGVQGLEGPEGPPGPEGPAGASAYAAALANGFVGTEAEWLASLGGPQGPVGPEGPEGPAGQAGPAGEGLEILGTLANTGELPASGTAGDGYLIDGDLWTWSGSAWVNSGPVRGPQGPAGPTGPVGATGASGASAYQIALANGFVGSEAEWLATLVGSEGPEGPQGAQGPAGASGLASVSANAGTAISLALADAGRYLRTTSATAVTVTVPAQASVAWLADTEVSIRVAGAGAVTLSAGAGVTLNAPSGGTLVLSQRMTVTLKRVAENEWDVIGQTVAA